MEMFSPLKIRLTKGFTKRNILFWYHDYLHTSNFFDDRWNRDVTSMVFRNMIMIFHMNHLGYYGNFLRKNGGQILSSKKFPFTPFLTIWLWKCFKEKTFESFSFFVNFPTSVDFPPTFQIVFHSSDSTLRTMFFVSL